MTYMLSTITRVEKPLYSYEAKVQQGEEAKRAVSISYHSFIET